MNCERIREQIPECLSGRMSAAERDKLVEHLESCANCRTEVAELNAVWRAMEPLKSAEKYETPDPAAKARFREMLEAYKAGMGVAVEMPSRRKTNWLSQPFWQTAIAAGLLIAGIFAGRFTGQPRQENPEVAQLKGQVESLRQLVALSMLQQQSPGARLRGVSYSEQIAQPDTQVRQALLFAVNHDSNVNVRLSAVDALQKFAGDAEVARAMVDAIAVQESPLVQVALVDMLVQMKARSIAPGLVRYTTDTQVDEVVRQRAVWALDQLGARQ